MINKKGQFFLISALIIITILLSFVTYRSRIQVYPVQEKVYDLGDELNLETAEVLDYGIYNKQVPVSKIFESWAGNFSSYHPSVGNEEFVFIFTDENGKTKGVRFSTQSMGSVSLYLGNRPIDLDQGDITELPVENLPSSGGEIKVSIGDQNYTIDYNPEDEKFYFVIKGMGGEVAQTRQ